MFKKAMWALAGLLLLGLLLPAGIAVPVAGANASSWHPKTFWYSPWGSSGTHKGVDIFAPKGTAVVAAAPGLVLWQGNLSKGGQVVLVLGAKWRLHYYAHLDQASTGGGRWLAKGEKLGTVGDSGNAKGKPPHLHYSLVSLLPYPWLLDGSEQGWKKMFYLDPIKRFP